MGKMRPMRLVRLMKKTIQAFGDVHADVALIIDADDGVAPRLEESDDALSRRDVAQVPDVEGFVGIRVGKLDEDAFSSRRSALFGF